MWLARRSPARGLKNSLKINDKNDVKISNKMNDRAKMDA